MTIDVAAHYRELASRGLTTLPLLIRAARHLWGMRHREALDLVVRLTEAGMLAEISTGPWTAVYSAGPRLAWGTT